MIRRLVILAMLLTLVFALGLTLTPPRPADADLRDFLLPPPGCEPPCWQGIRPGVTTMDEAVRLLEANPWVERVEVSDRFLTHYITWEWSDQAPAYIDDPAARTPATMLVAGSTIQYISLATSISYGDLWVLWGKPDGGSFNVSGSGAILPLLARPNTVHTAAYFGGRVTIGTQLFCPINPQAFWKAPVSIIYYNIHSTPTFNSPIYPLSDWFYSQPCGAG